MDTVCNCPETLSSRGVRHVPKGHNCAYSQKRSALVFEASMWADQNCPWSEDMTAEEQADAFNRAFTAAMDKLCEEAGLI